MQDARIVLFPAGIWGFTDFEALPLADHFFHGLSLCRFCEVLLAQAGSALWLLIPKQIGNLAGHLFLSTESL